MLPSEPGQMAAVLIAFAVIDGSRSHISGKGNQRTVACHRVNPARKKTAAAGTSTRAKSNGILLDCLGQFLPEAGGTRDSVSRRQFAENRTATARSR
jgi:hypothetical protein